MERSEIRSWIIIELFWGLVCLVLAAAFWAWAFIEIDKAFIKTGQGGTLAVIFVLVINLSHYFWGFFHTSEDVGEVAPSENKGPLMHSTWESDRIHIRIIAFLTIGCSVYLQRAIRWSRVEGE